MQNLEMRIGRKVPASDANHQPSSQGGCGLPLLPGINESAWARVFCTWLRVLFYVRVVLVLRASLPPPGPWKYHFAPKSLSTEIPPNDLRIPFSVHLVFPLAFLSSPQRLYHLRDGSFMGDLTAAGMPRYLVKVCSVCVREWGSLRDQPWKRWAQGRSCPPGGALATSPQPGRTRG